MTKYKNVEMDLIEGEYWWGGVVRHSVYMPFGAHEERREELCRNLDGNQGCPMLVSSKGRYVWCEEPFSFEFKGGRLIIDDVLDEVFVGDGYENLRGAYRAVCEKYFPGSCRMPDELSFTAPQYNAWIDMHRDPTQEKVLRYAREILDSGMPPGILMIDDFWYKYNGLWQWDSEAFAEPREMVAKLHEWGFKVVLWVSPYVSSDTKQYIDIEPRGYLLRDEKGDVAIHEWWNGYSAVLDLSNPEAFGWLQGQLDELVDEYGIDGFKFDAGDPYRYKVSDKSFAARTPVGHCEDFARVGLKYDIAEYRACWKLGGKHLLQRVRDQRQLWEAGPGGGLSNIIPFSLVQGLIGYPYTCPDMVGGGENTDFYTEGFEHDQELFVRWAQASTFFPVIQYSSLPSRVLDDEHLGYVMKMIELRREIGLRVLELAREASKTGEPIMRHMAYVFPEAGMEEVVDQYMLGDDVLVAPVMTQGARSRVVKLPAGKWEGDDGIVVEGDCEIEIDVPLERLAWYKRV